MAIFRTGRFSKTRLEAFSDGVFAIIITLLVLDLQVPVVRGPDISHQLLDALILLLPKLMSWVISFAVVCILWVNHHRLFALLSHVDNGLLWLNCLFLLVTSFIPFPTALMGAYMHERVPVIFFGIVMALVGLLFGFMRLYATGKAGLIVAEADPVMLRKVNTRSLLFGPGLYTAGMLASFIRVEFAVVIYALIPLYFVLPRMHSGAGPRQSKSIAG